MNADEILDALRPAVLVVDESGVVIDLRGGFGSSREFFGYGIADFVGRSVFDFVAARQVDELATYFIESSDRSNAALSLPLPFRLSILAADGLEHPVDVIPSGNVHADGELRWVVVVVPVSLQTSISTSLEAEMAGAPRERVKELLTEELAVDNVHYSTRWFLVDLDVVSGPRVTTSRTEDRPMAEALEKEVAGGWRPWGPVPAGGTAPLVLEDLPDPLRALATGRDWRRVSVTPVHISGALVAAYLLFGRVPADYVVTEINRNVLSRIERLVDATALLIARWRDRDRLVAAATRDPLTGLANRDAFADALADAGEHTTLMYIDIDHFKRVNDRYGHDVGDRVLVEISRRIVGACRPTDVVARFGGDEFVVLLEGVEPQTARAIGERIIDLVDEPIEELDAPERVTVSVGMATLVDRDEIVKSADQAMLEAKRTGRARLVEAERVKDGA